MNKASKITLLVVTILFIGITAWRVIALISESNPLVGRIELIGPAEVAAGRFDENNYIIKAYLGDGTEKEVKFRAVYFDDESYNNLSVVGTHILTFTYENCRGTFELTVIKADE